MTVRTRIGAAALMLATLVACGGGDPVAGPSSPAVVAPSSDAPTEAPETSEPTTPSEPATASEPSTPSEPATAEPTQVATESGDVVFEEDFEDGASPWEELGEQTSVEVTGGAMVLKVGDYTPEFTVEPPDDQVSELLMGDVSVEATFLTPTVHASGPGTIDKPSEPTDPPNVGVTCWGRTSTENVKFKLLADGGTMIERYVTALHDGSTEPAASFQPDGPNVVRGECLETDDGARFVMYVNGEEVASADEPQPEPSDEYWTYGSAGVFVQAPDGDVDQPVDRVAISARARRTPTGSAACADEPGDAAEGGFAGSDIESVGVAVQDGQFVGIIQATEPLATTNPGEAELNWGITLLNFDAIVYATATLEPGATEFTGSAFGDIRNGFDFEPIIEGNSLTIAFGMDQVPYEGRFGFVAETSLDFDPIDNCESDFEPE